MLLLASQGTGGRTIAENAHRHADARARLQRAARPARSRDGAERGDDAVAARRERAPEALGNNTSAINKLSNSIAGFAASNPHGNPVGMNAGGASFGTSSQARRSRCSALLARVVPGTVRPRAPPGAALRRAERRVLAPLALASPPPSGCWWRWLRDQPRDGAQQPERQPVLVALLHGLRMEQSSPRSARVCPPRRWTRTPRRKPLPPPDADAATRVTMDALCRPRRSLLRGRTFPVQNAPAQGGNDVAEHVAYLRRGADVEPTGLKAYRGTFTIPLINTPRLEAIYGQLFPGCASTSCGCSRAPRGHALASHVRCAMGRDYLLGRAASARAARRKRPHGLVGGAQRKRLLLVGPEGQTPANTPTTVSEAATEADTAMAAVGSGYTPVARTRWTSS